jgi:hypothetical protein
VAFGVTPAWGEAARPFSTQLMDSLAPGVSIVIPGVEAVPASAQLVYFFA